jgi:hypothetical protein
VASFAGLMLAQGWLIVAFVWYADERSFSLPLMLLKIALVCALLAAAVLFWAVRLKSAGATAIATVLTILALWPWVIANPIPVCEEAGPGCWLPPARVTLDQMKAMVVIALSAVLFYLYARRRLRRPEGMLS